MFIPNTTANLYVQLATADIYGKHSYDPVQTVKCSVIFLDAKVQKSSVRADTSGSRGQADQVQGDARMLFPKTLPMKIGDVIFIDGQWFEVIAYVPRRDALGKVDHNQAEFRKREAI